MISTEKKLKSTKTYLWYCYIAIANRISQIQQVDIVLPRIEKTVKCFVTVAIKRDVNERFIIALLDADVG